jgi:glycosyltransferase involved in cell wall biosynthesis
MKILQINSCHYRRGGADVVYLNTIGILRKNGDEVIEFSQVSEQNEKSDYSDYFVENLDVLNASFLNKVLKTPALIYSIESSKKLTSLIEKYRPEIAHIHLYKGILTASILSTLKKLNIPTVITLHDYSLLCPRNILYDADNKVCELCIKSTTLNCIRKRCNRKNLFYSTVNWMEFGINNYVFKPHDHFSKIICVSKFNLEKHSQLKNIENKLVHLYNFFPDFSTVLPNSTKGSYFLFFGRLSLEKGLKTLILAFIKSGASHLKIVGTGPLEDELKDMIVSQKITNIEILGFKKGKELQELIQNASFIIVPSEWYENNPMTIVEGYSYGKPVIGSCIGGIPELIEDGKTGFNFEMGNVDELAEKLSVAQNITQQEYAIMSVKSREFALKNFSETIHYEKLMDIYRDVLKH